MKSKLAKMVSASKSNHKEKVHTKLKARAARAVKRGKTALHRQRQRLRRRIQFTLRRVTRMVNDMYHKISSWLSVNYRCVLLPSFQTSEMVRRYEKEVKADGALVTSTDKPTTRGRKRKVRKEPKVRNSTARAMLAQAHYKFKLLLRYKMERVGGCLVDCEEEFTSQTCSWCGTVNSTLGSKRVFACSSCRTNLDRDVNAARNILHKNREMLA